MCPYSSWLTDQPQASIMIPIYKTWHFDSVSLYHHTMKHYNIFKYRYKVIVLMTFIFISCCIHTKSIDFYPSTWRLNYTVRRSVVAIKDSRDREKSNMLWNKAYWLEILSIVWSRHSVPNHLWFKLSHICISYYILKGLASDASFENVGTIETSREFETYLSYTSVGHFTTFIHISYNMHSH